jgi:putative transposase
MSQSFANILVHLIFSTKDRRPLIRDDVREHLHAYIVGILENQQFPSLQTNSAEDHAHILFVLSKNLPLAKVVQEVKQSSSKWIKGRGADYSDFGWQNGYAAFSVSEFQRDVVREYIRTSANITRRFRFKTSCANFSNGTVSITMSDMFGIEIVSVRMRSPNRARQGFALSGLNHFFFMFFQGVALSYRITGFQPFIQPLNGKLLR